MKRIMLLGIFALLVMLSAPQKAYAMAQITMVNQTKVQLTLYIDGNFGCGPALPHGNFCTSSVTPGPHTLRAVAPNGQYMEERMDIPDGASPSWTVCYANDNSGPCKSHD